MIICVPVLEAHPRATRFAVVRVNERQLFAAARHRAALFMVHLRKTEVADVL